jgi:hypothetical protein
LYPFRNISYVTSRIDIFFAGKKTGKGFFYERNTAVLPASLKTRAGIVGCGISNGGLGGKGKDIIQEPVPGLVTTCLKGGRCLLCKDECFKTNVYFMCKTKYLIT